ncbi:mechanosensitive ion channel domain-containing protein [Ekhidna sp.]|uniref:mechanosensitive ion channel domain-containing protein n=1 Tax=Ekhidna sp. TaxID=2608089 RepID=UPI003B5108CC
MKKLIIVLSILMFSVGAFGQTSENQSDSVQRKLNSLTQQLGTYQRLLNQNKLQRKQDSLARIDLMKRIQLLQESDKFNQVSLREQIREIELRDSARNAAQKSKILKLRETIKGFVVAPDEDSLFTIYTKLGPIMAEERAVNVSEKIDLLIRDDYFFVDSLYIDEHEGTVDIMYRNLIVTSVSDWDALWIEGESKESLANKYRETIGTFIVDQRNRSTVRNIAARFGLVFLILGVAVLIIYFLNRLFKGLQGWFVMNKKKYFTGIRIGNYEFLPPERQLDVVVRGVGILKWGFFALVLYFSLPIIFGLFPFTKHWAETLMGWILSPAQNILLSFWNYLPNAFTIAVIYVITSYLVRFLKFISHEIEVGNLKITGFHEDWAMPTYNIVKFLIYAFMFVVIFPYLPGSDSDVFKGVSVFLGILFSLGSSSAIANAVAGLVITYMRPFRLGDRVKIGEVTGQVVEKTLLVTRVRTTKNEDITVPNAAILNGHTVNYTSSSKELGLVLHTSVTIGYDVPWRKVHELLIEAAVVTDGVNISKEPFVLQTSLDDWYVAYQLNAFTDLPEQMPKIYSELHANIQDKFNAAGVEIMSPHYRAVRDGNAITIPKEPNGKD